MRQQLSTLQKIKTAIHAVTALSIFIAACIQIAVFTGPGSADGRSKYYFALCWLSIPALIYLVAVPIWSRATNVAKALWFAIVDSLYTLLWLVAFACVLAWNNSGTKQGAKDQKKPASDADCSTFAYGSEKQCKLSYAVSGFGVWIFILFLATSGISIFYTIKAKKNPQAEDPWLAPSAQNSSYAPAMNDAEHNPSATKDPIWDTSMNNDDDEGDDERGPYAHNIHPNDQDGYAHETDDGRHPGRPVHWGPLDGPDHGAAPPYGDTEYRGASAYQAPSAMSPTTAHSPPRHDAYDSYGSGRGRQGAYSFSGV